MLILDEETDLLKRELWLRRFSSGFPHWGDICGIYMVCLAFSFLKPLSKDLATIKTLVLHSGVHNCTQVRVLDVR